MPAFGRNVGDIAPGIPTALAISYKHGHMPVCYIEI